jgi:hypothetical protein
LVLFENTFGRKTSITEVNRIKTNFARFSTDMVSNMTNAICGINPPAPLRGFLVMGHFGRRTEVRRYIPLPLRGMCS